MELKIQCDASIELESFTNLKNIKYEIMDSGLVDDTLSGNVKIEGSYMKDDLEKEYSFYKIEPFTVVFKNKNYNINDLKLDDFVSSEIINYGLECNFSLVVNYDEKKNSDKSEVLEEKSFKEEANDDVSIDNLKADEFVEENSSSLKEEITEKYDNLLQKILETRDDNFLEENEEIVEEEEESNVSIVDSTSKQNYVFSSVEEKYTLYKVFYTQKETEIENICQKEKISIDKIYKDNAHTDFINKRRIIIK